MKLFSWGRKKEPERFIDRINIDKSSWRQVYSACLGKMMAIQTACGEQVVRGRDWHVDFAAGRISFGDDSFPIQFLGSESSQSNTWLWGWENINGFDGDILRLARSTRELGQSRGLEPLTEAQFDLDDTYNGHNLSIVACGLAEGYCYYRGPHPGGAVFVAFSGVPDSVFAPVDAERFISLTLQCVRQAAIDHQVFAESFLIWNRTKFDWQGDTLTARFPQAVKITFEQAGNVRRIKSITNR